MNYICNDCPRKCNIERNENNPSGFCMSFSLPTVVRAAPHFGEEPCISGTKGSGAVFFSGCNLRCEFCQNVEISRGVSGKMLDKYALKDVFEKLQSQNVHNINLVTPTHFSRVIKEALEISDLNVPVVWNSSGYESVDTLKSLEGLVDIYMPDYKYSDSAIALKYSAAKNYPEVAAEAIAEMYRQRGRYVLDDDGIMKSGVLIRHLILPESTENSMDVIDFIADNFSDGEVLFSLMSQYTPMSDTVSDEKLKKRVTDDENNDLIHYMRSRKIFSGYYQETESSTKEMIPDFDLTGLK